MVPLNALEFIAVNMHVFHANWVSLQVVGTCTTWTSNLRSILENSPDVASLLIWEVAVQCTRDEFIINVIHRLCGLTQGRPRVISSNGLAGYFDVGILANQVCESQSVPKTVAVISSPVLYWVCSETPVILCACSYTARWLGQSTYLFYQPFRKQRELHRSR